eukprot:8029832-Ditylum_brightwellii.AAC.1
MYKYGNNIAESLNELTKPDTDALFPSLIVNADADSATKSREDEESKMKFKAALDEVMRHKRSYKEQAQGEDRFSV